MWATFQMRFLGPYISAGWRNMRDVIVFQAEYKMTLDVVNTKIKNTLPSKSLLRNIFTLSVRDRLQTSETDVYKRQILKYDVDPRTERLQIYDGP